MRGSGACQLPKSNSVRIWKNEASGLGSFIAAEKRMVSLLVNSD